MFDFGAPLGRAHASPVHATVANAIANGADGICICAYLVRHMIGLNYTVEELERERGHILQQAIL